MWGPPSTLTRNHMVHISKTSHPQILTDFNSPTALLPTIYIMVLDTVVPYIGLVVSYREGKGPLSLILFTICELIKDQLSDES